MGKIFEAWKKLGYKLTGKKIKDSENLSTIINDIADKYEGGGGIAYTAGDNIQINDGVISATDTTYTAGENITIEDGVISATGGGADLGLQFQPNQKMYNVIKAFLPYDEGSSAYKQTKWDITKLKQLLIDAGVDMTLPAGVYDNNQTTQNISLAFHYTVADSQMSSQMVAITPENLVIEFSKSYSEASEPTPAYYMYTITIYYMYGAIGSAMPEILDSITSELSDYATLGDNATIGDILNWVISEEKTLLASYVPSDDVARPFGTVRDNVDYNLWSIPAFATCIVAVGIGDSSSSYSGAEADIVGFADLDDIIDAVEPVEE